MRATTGQDWSSLRRTALVIAAALGLAAMPLAAAPAVQVVTEDGRVYDAYVPAALKQGQFYNYTCEFDAAWSVLKTFGFDVPFEEQLAIVGHDQRIEPYYQETPSGFVIYGGDITADYSGDYTSNLLARATGAAMRPLFERYGLPTKPVHTRKGIETALDGGGLVWTKATVDFLPWQPVTWITPDGKEVPGVLGNDHAVVVMGYNDDVVVIRDLLGPTDTNWNRAYEYEVPWATFMAVWEAQAYDGLAVMPPGDDGAETAPFDPIEVTGSLG